MPWEFKKDQFSNTEYMNNIFLNPYKSQPNRELREMQVYTVYLKTNILSIPGK